MDPRCEVGGFVFRPARASDAAALTELAHASKRHWGYDEEWITLWQDDLTFTPEIIASQIVHVAEQDSGIVGVLALSHADDQAELQALWVHPDVIGRGLGGELFRRAVDLTQTFGATSLSIVSDPHAEAFYRHMGAVPIGITPSKPAGRFLPVLAYSLTSEGA